MFNVRVEFECTPIRHIAVQCPKCENWFRGLDILECGTLRFAYDINYAIFKCPLCEKEFGSIAHGDKPVVEEFSHPDVYKGILEKKEKVVWE